MQIPYEVTARRDTGLWNAKIGIWLFLASEVMLFGGLFSGYVFLRVGIIPGVDNPWPIEVQKIIPGFINTLVLIASSVFVVLAWVALKERSWRRFQYWMGAVIVCAGLFLVIKAYEYTAKFTHHGLKLTDNAILEGEVVGGTDRIRFEGSEITVDLSTGSMLFLDYLEGSVPRFITPDGEEVQAEQWIKKERSKFLKAKFASRKERRRAVRDKDEPDAEIVSAFEALQKANPVTLKAVEPFKLRASHRRATYTDDSMNFADGSKVAGKLLGDEVEFIVHEIDMQMVPLAEQRDSMVWDVVDDPEAKDTFFDKQKKMLAKYEAYYGEDPMPMRHLQSRKVNVHKVHLSGAHGSEHGSEHAEAEKPATETGGPEKEEGHGDEKAGAHGDGHGDDHVTRWIPRDKIAFLSNHGPAYNTYYAIYFTMTGLHGLHVIGGAIVLGYFLFFGKSLYLRNPEHMANRVEVGGLFWHFVDLVWIFLFPIMYLF